jgi:hypothetical protein
MKIIQLNWKRSLATLTLLTGLGGSEAALARDAQPPSASNPALPSAAAPADSTSPSADAAAFLRRYGIDPSGQKPGAPAPQVPGSTRPAGLAAAQEAAEAFRRRYGLDASGPRPSAARREDSQHGAQLAAKLREMVMAEVSFDGLPLGDVLQFLSEESRKLDPEKKGMNFLINPNPPSLASPAPIDPATGLPMAASLGEPVDISTVVVKFNLPLRNVSMSDILDAVVKVADRPIEYSLEDYAVVFSLRADSAQSVVPRMPTGQPSFGVRTFSVNTNTFVAGLESAFGIKIDPPAKGDGSGRSKKVQSALKELLTQLGIAAEGNKSVFYNELTGMVMVRATPDDLEIVRAAIETLGGFESSGAR